jgi:hypothetical protein
MSKRNCENVVRQGVIKAHGDCLLMVVHDCEPDKIGSVFEVWMAKTVSDVMSLPETKGSESLPAIRVERSSVKLTEGHMQAGAACPGKKCETCILAVYPDTEATRDLLLRMEQMYMVHQAAIRLHA